jgi:hypothetical protein
VITRASTLADVCFAVTQALETHGMIGILTGGSAAAIYAPQAYLSNDADFVMLDDESLGDIAVALRALGFEREGRSRLFSHPESEFTLDFPKGPLAVGGDYVRETHVVDRDGVSLRILTRTDCVRDRLAHFYHWDDYTALNAAVAVAAANIDEVDMEAVEQWTTRESEALTKKFHEFKRRLGLT